MSTATLPDKSRAQAPKQTDQLPAIGGPRLPFHPAIEERFGVDRASWKALVEAVFPNATSVESVILALSYCRARKLDPFKRNVHIVPIYDKNRRCMVDTIWPGIGELRTTAFRTGEYAGRGETIFGPDITKKVGTVEITFPEWAQVVVYRLVQGQRVEFWGPRVYWLETYATVKRDDDTPNEMWATRVRGQIDKCAEAAALRAAFPEEIGGDCISDEVRGAGVMGVDVPSGKVQSSRLNGLLGKETLESTADALDSNPPIVSDESNAAGLDQSGEQSQADDTENENALAGLDQSLSECQTEDDINAVESSYKPGLSARQLGELADSCAKRRKELTKKK